MTGLVDLNKRLESKFRSPKIFPPLELRAEKESEEESVSRRSGPINPLRMKSIHGRGSSMDLRIYGANAGGLPPGIRRWWFLVLLSTQKYGKSIRFMELKIQNYEFRIRGLLGIWQQRCGCILACFKLRRSIATLGMTFYGEHI